MLEISGESSKSIANQLHASAKCLNHCIIHEESSIPKSHLLKFIHYLHDLFPPWSAESQSARNQIEWNLSVCYIADYFPRSKTHQITFFALLPFNYWRTSQRFSAFSSMHPPLKSYCKAGIHVAAAANVIPRAIASCRRDNGTTSKGPRCTMLELGGKL